MDTDVDTPPFEGMWEDWDSLSQDAQTSRMEDQGKVTEYLSEDSTIRKFAKECEKIGQTAVAIDIDFKKVETALTKLGNKYREQFPGVAQEYLPKWIGLKSRWEGKKGILWASRTFASTTVVALSDYDTTLDVVAKITCKEDLKNAQSELRSYVDRHPISDATEIADRFKNLSRDVGDFSTDFDEYINEQKQYLTEDAKKCEADITKYQEEVFKFNHKIMIAAVTFGCTWVFGLLALIPLGFALYFVQERNKAQAKLDKAKAKLAENSRRQMALAAMQAGFEELKPNIDDICFKLGIFAGIWAFVTGQCVEIDGALNVGMSAVTERKFIGNIDLLRAQIKPLKEGLRTYVQQIVKK